MLRNRLNGNRAKNGLNTTPLYKKTNESEPISRLNERKIALLGLVFSLLVITVKIFNEHYSFVENLLFERKLVSYDIITENGQIMFTNSWETAVRYSNFWLPLACGFLATYFTWMCVYLDSNVPGVNPPSPLSPQSYRAQSGHRFHLNYVFAVGVGVLLTTYLYCQDLKF